MKKPPTEKISAPPLEIFAIREPIEEVEVKGPNGEKAKEWRYAVFHFTTADKPVTYGGVQYIPLSSFDQIRWNKKIK
jgi:hypothetical protein